MRIPRLPPKAPRKLRILVDYRGSWGLGDLLCSEPLVRGLAERHGDSAEIRYRGEAGNAAFSPCFAGPAPDDYPADLTIAVELFNRMPLEQYAVREAMPSLVDHMCSYGGVFPTDRTPRLNLGEEETALLRELELDRLPRPLAAICADGSDHYRAWPIQRYRAVAEHLKQRGATVLEIGTREPLGVGIDLVDQLPIRGTAAVLSACDLFVGNNSGPFHYAQAAGVPCVTFFSLALPERFIHDGRLVIPVQNEELACIDCMTRDFAERNRSGCTAAVDAACMADLPTARGIEAVDLLLDGYLAHRDSDGVEGPRARAFRAKLLMDQANRLLDRGHGPRAARFLGFAAEACRRATMAAVQPEALTAHR